MVETSFKAQSLDSEKLPNGNQGYIDDLFLLKYQLKGRHNGSVNTVKFSPDGTAFATGSSDCSIKVFSLSTGDCTSELIGHSQGISGVDFSPINPDVLASCSDDMTVRLWSIKRQQCIKILKNHTYHVTAVKFNFKGNILISASADETITIWDLVSGTSLRKLAAHSDPVASIALTPDSSMVISGSYDGLMRIFDLETGQCLKTLTSNTSHGTATASTAETVNFPISHVESTPNGKYILSSSLDGRIRLWDYMNGKVVKTYLGPKNGEIPICEKYCCDSIFVTKTVSPLMLSGSDNSGVFAWDVQTKSIVYQYEMSSSPVLGLVSYDEGSIVACCSKEGTISILLLNSKYIKELTENFQDNPAPTSVERNN